MTLAEKEVRRLYKLTGEGVREAIIVTPDLRVRYAFGLEHSKLMDEAGYDRKDESVLLTSYFPIDNVLWFTWPNRPFDVREGGVFEEHFNVLYKHLSDRYSKFGPRTKVDWSAGVGRRKTLGEELGPSMFHRRPKVHVRQHRRQR